VEDTLQELHRQYQGQMVSTLSWGGGGERSGEAGQEFLDEIVERFWEAVEGPP